MHTLSPDLAAEPAAASPPDWLPRLEAVEGFTGQLGQAVEQLVEAVIELRTAAAPPPEGASGPEVLLKRVQQLEGQWQLQQTLSDLERVSRFHPKTRSVVFVGTTYFGCNVKYGWLAVREQARREGITLWWLPQTEQQQRDVLALGERCFPLNPADWRAEHVSAALQAAVVVACDHLLNPNPYVPALLAGARVVQLWHGVSIKEIGLGNRPGLKQMNARVARVLATTGPFSRFIGTSASQEADFRRWFGLQRYEPIGYPRNDVLLREPTPEDLLGTDAATLQAMREARAAGRRVVLYAPTFRDARRGVWIIEAGLDRVARELQQRGELLVVALHPVEAPMLPQLAPALSGVRFVAPRTDLYPLLREASVLITDYSSVMFDYLLLDRPVLLFRPDHRDYQASSRTLDERKLDPLPGPLATDVDALLAQLRPKALAEDRRAADRRLLRQRLHDHQDGRSGERLAALLLDELALALAAPTP